jgi:hypothetical protein
MKYEYKVIVNLNTNPLQLEDKLNDFSRDGWRPVAMNNLGVESMVILARKSQDIDPVTHKDFE